MRVLVRPLLGVVLVALLLALASRLRPLVGSPVLMLALLIPLALAAHALFLRWGMRLRPGDILPKKSAAS